MSIITARHDGMLKDVGIIPTEHAELLFTRLKIIGRLVSYQKRVPQDGHIDPQNYTDDPSVDIRIAIAPTVNGEQAVIRILYGSGGLIPLESLGWEPDSLEKYKEIIFRKRGVVLTDRSLRQRQNNHNCSFTKNSYGGWFY